jgi:hypothetical protein
LEGIKKKRHSREHWIFWQNTRINQVDFMDFYITPGLPAVSLR